MSEQRIAVVTGANRGIGLEIVRGLLARGVYVIATARNIGAAEELQALAAGGDQLSLQSLDVSSRASVDALRDHLRQRFGRLDILINNAGIALDKFLPALALDIEVYRRTMETNLYGPLRLCQAFVPMMCESGYGRVVNVSSELGSLSQVQMGSTLAYRSSKTALNALTVLLDRELADYEDILVNAACPGWVKTELGGEDAPLTPAEGADTAIWLAVLPKGGPRGGLFRERQPYPW